MRKRERRIEPDDPDAGHAVYELSTPEGVPLRFGIASAGDRFAAAAIDLSIVLGAFILLLMGVGLLAIAVPDADELYWVGAVLLLVFFLLRHFYFMGFELRWRGRTPGKRLRGLKVIDAHGDPLTTEAIIVRNLTREIEVFFPLLVLIMPDVVWPGIPWWMRLIASAWVVVFALMPVFNRNRQRIGDLVGGTLVIIAPRRRLLADQAAPRLVADDDVEAEPAYRFEDRQLAIYGIYELQVLEDVLRKKNMEQAPQLFARVGNKIRRKIDWQGEVDSEEAFLRAFYAALRARLERGMLLGRRREDQFDRDRG